MYPSLQEWGPSSVTMTTHTMLSMWQGEPSYNKETNGFPTSWPLENIVCLTNWGRDKMDAILQTTF